MQEEEGARARRGRAAIPRDYNHQFLINERSNPAKTHREPP